jgi:hypothetical protein
VATIVDYLGGAGVTRHAHRPYGRASDDVGVFPAGLLPMPDQAGGRVLADAVLCVDGPVTSLVGLSLAAEHRRGQGALYDAVNVGRIDVARLRTRLAGLPLPLPLPRMSDGPDRPGGRCEQLAPPARANLTRPAVLPCLRPRQGPGPPPPGRHHRPTVCAATAEAVLAIVAILTTISDTLRSLAKTVTATLGEHRTGRPSRRCQGLVRSTPPRCSRASVTCTDWAIGAFTRSVVPATAAATARSWVASDSRGGW